MENVATVHLPFSEVRRICEEQISFTKKCCPWAESVSLRTSFNHELQIFDLDWDEFMWPWFKEFKLPIHEQFNYYDYFWDGELLPVYWFKAIRFAVKNNSPVVWWPPRPNKPDLTVGDFAASVMLGQFVKREDLRVVFTPH